MIHELSNAVYNNSFNPVLKASEDSLIVYFDGQNVLCLVDGDVKSLENAVPGKLSKDSPSWYLPSFKELSEVADLTACTLTYLFNITIEGNRKDFFLLTDRNIFTGTSLSPDDCSYRNFHYINALKFRSLKPLNISFAVITALQLYCWYRDNTFCGRCGTPLVPDDKERMLKCPDCSNMVYPKICPGVIVGIVSKGRILLTKYARKGYNRYALVAGFTEIGESLEESAAREALEEVGLKIKNITFYKSQPWSASSSLLAGFFAEVDGSDEVTLDAEELKEGTWFYPEDIVKMNEGVSLTEEMINCFAERGLPESWYKI